MSRLKLSVVMPTFNEAQALPLVVADIRKYAAAYDTEILIVDSSKDDTPAVAESLGVKVISQPPQGHGIALRTAIQSASGDYIVTADCDNTYPMDRIPDFVDLLDSQGYDVVSGNRLGTAEVKRAMPGANLWANRSFAFLVRVLYGIRTHDVTTGMFGFRRQAAHAVAWETNYAFPAEIIIRSHLAGLRYHEVPISYKLRVGEVTLHRWRSGKAYLKCFLKYRFHLRTPPEKL
jgi:glycosyltransferase involved in cell wall biosynthesis